MSSLRSARDQDRRELRPYLPAASQRGKGSFLPVPGGKALGRYSDWLRWGHVPFPGPMAVVKVIGYYDWPELEFSVQVCSQEGMD